MINSVGRKNFSSVVRHRNRISDTISAINFGHPAQFIANGAFAALGTKADYVLGRSLWKPTRKGQFGPSASDN